MYAVIVSGGKQYRVMKDDIVSLEKLPQAVGDSVEFDQILMLKNGDNVQVGTPIVTGAKVKGTVVENGRGKKINVIKFKRRKNYLKKQGHRQDFTKVKITDIIE